MVQMRWKDDSRQVELAASRTGPGGEVDVAGNSTSIIKVSGGRLALRRAGRLRAVPKAWAVGGMVPCARAPGGAAACWLSICASKGSPQYCGRQGEFGQAVL